MPSAHILKKTYNDHLQQWRSQSRKSTSMRAYGNHRSVYSHVVTQQANEQARDGKLGQNMPGFSSNDPGLSLSFKIRPCCTCGISCTMMSPRHTTLRTERCWPWRKCQTELHLEFLGEVWQTGWTNTHGGFSESCRDSCIFCKTKNKISEWQSLNSDIEIKMWIFLENDLVSILSISQNLALLSVAAGHKLSVTDNRYFGVKQIKFHAS